MEENIPLENRYCPICKENKTIDLFYIRKKTSGRIYTHKCKECQKRDYYKYREENKERILKQNRDARWRNLEKYKAKDKRYRDNNSEKHCACSRRWYQNNKQRVYENKKKWVAKNRERVRNNARDRRKKDFSFNIRCILATRLYDLLKGRNKSKTTLQLLGCTLEEFKRHLESQFTEGMSWENYGRYTKNNPKKWNVDHIRQCCTFDLTKPEEQEKCFHYSNLRPLWGKENLSRPKRT